MIENILNRLSGVKHIGERRWVACCPSHKDKRPSLSIRAEGDKILLHCFAECDTRDILDAIEVPFSALFLNPLNKRNGRPFSAEQVLECISDAAIYVAIVSQRMANGEQLSDETVKRLIQASKRIQHARAVYGWR